MKPDDFLNSCYEEEKSLYKQMAAVQGVIRVKGGFPKHPFALAVTPKVAKLDTSKFKSAELFPETYSAEKWTWERKTLYAFDKRGSKANPSEVIEFLIEQEPQTDGKIIKSNVYNNISRLVKKHDLEKVREENGVATYALIQKPRFVAGL